MPRPTGTVVFAASGRRRTKPASTSPISAMNAPIPTAIADLRAGGTAVNTAVRKPVTASTTMTRPSITTRPMASGQVIMGAIVTASRVLMPRPVAIAAEDQGVEDDDVRHRHERDEASAQLAGTVEPRCDTVNRRSNTATP